MKPVYLTDEQRNWIVDELRRWTGWTAFICALSVVNFILGLPGATGWFRTTANIVGIIAFGVLGLKAFATYSVVSASDQRKRR